MDLHHLKDLRDVQHDFKASWPTGFIVQHFEIEVFSLPILLL